MLLIGYPIAYGMARLPKRWQSVAMMLVIVPFWTSFLIRIYAWINILQHDGLLNEILLALHLVSTPVVWLSTDTANAIPMNRLEGVVTEVNYLGGVTTYKVKLDSGAVLRASMANTARLDMNAYSASQRVTAWFTPDDCVVLEQ